MNKTYKTKSDKEMQEIAAEFIKEFISENKKSNKVLVVGLRGDLGAGKTTFTQGVLRELGIERNISSPTFVLIKRYLIKEGQYENFYHIDAYRLENGKELLKLNFKEVLEDKNSIIFIEWPENVKDILKGVKYIDFGYGDEDNERVIKF